MSWRIKIGVDKHGGCLIGAAFIRAAEVAGELAAFEVIWPSQMEHRCAVHLAATLPGFGDGDRWIIVTPRKARELIGSGQVDKIRKFPKAKHDMSIRKSQPHLRPIKKGRDHGKSE